MRKDLGWKSRWNDGSWMPPMPRRRTDGSRWARDGLHSEGLMMVPIILLGALSVLGVAEEPPDIAGNTLQFTDDFHADSRPRYELGGPIGWEPGRLTLRSGASLVRKVAGGPSAS